MSVATLPFLFNQHTNSFHVIHEDVLSDLLPDPRFPSKRQQKRAKYAPNYLNCNSDLPRHGAKNACDIPSTISDSAGRGDSWALIPSCSSPLLPQRDTSGADAAARSLRSPRLLSESALSSSDASRRSFTKAPGSEADSASSLWTQPHAREGKHSFQATAIHSHRNGVHSILASTVHASSPLPVGEAHEMRQRASGRIGRQREAFFQGLVERSVPDKRRPAQGAEVLQGKQQPLSQSLPTRLRRSNADAQPAEAALPLLPRPPRQPKPAGADRPLLAAEQPLAAPRRSERLHSAASRALAAIHGATPPSCVCGSDALPAGPASPHAAAPAPRPLRARALRARARQLWAVLRTHIAGRAGGQLARRAELLAGLRELFAETLLREAVRENRRVKRTHMLEVAAAAENAGAPEEEEGALALRLPERRRGGGDPRSAAAEAKRGASVIAAGQRKSKRVARGLEF